MKTIQITQNLIQSTTLNQFRGSDGRARMNMPYYVEIEGHLSFEFIGAHTDRNLLEDQINAGIVFIQDKYAEAENTVNS